MTKDYGFKMDARREDVLRRASFEHDEYPGTTDLYERDNLRMIEVEYLYQRGMLAREGGRLLATAKGRAALGNVAPIGPSDTLTAVRRGGNRRSRRLASGR